jgi:hypothetical protein
VPSLSNLFSAKAYVSYARRRWGFGSAQLDETNWRAIMAYPPGHFYSALLDVKTIGEAVPFDGSEMWENVDLRREEQKKFYTDLLAECPPLPFPKEKNTSFRHYLNNTFFCEADAYTLSAILRRHRPRRVIEVGSGFSSAVMLDVLDCGKEPTDLTFIEPYPDRLYALLSGRDKSSTRILVKSVQDVPLGVFAELQAGDVFFIDSSHVAKVGSDVAFLILRVLPQLAPGVWVHVHDIFYPSTYPSGWLKEGRAWNESLFLRAYLVAKPRIEIMAFNCYAGQTFPELFKQRFPAFLANSGGSIWLRTT